MKQKIISQIIACITIITLWNSCASISGFQTGRTIGAETGEIMFSINGARTPDFDQLKEYTDSTSSKDFSIFAPNVEVAGRYGITDRLDFGIRANTNLNIYADVKFQLVGDQESPVAVATGLGIGMFGFLTGLGGLYNFQIPLYASFHPTDNLDLYIAPRYVGQWGSAFGKSSGLINYFGTNVGFLTGQRIKYGVDIGYYGLSNSDTGFNDSLFQIGFGVKFKIGGRE